MNSLMSFDSYFPRRSVDEFEVGWVGLDPSLDYSDSRLVRDDKKKIFQKISKTFSNLSCTGRKAEA